jgi:hypothetical protein
MWTKKDHRDWVWIEREYEAKEFLRAQIANWPVEQAPEAGYADGENASSHVHPSLAAGTVTPHGASKQLNKLFGWWFAEADQPVLFPVDKLMRAPLFTGPVPSYAEPPLCLVLDSPNKVIGETTIHEDSRAWERTKITDSPPASSWTAPLQTIKHPEIPALSGADIITDPEYWEDRTILLSLKLALMDGTGFCCLWLAPDGQVAGWSKEPSMATARSLSRVTKIPQDIFLLQNPWPQLAPLINNLREISSRPLTL